MGIDALVRVKFFARENIFVHMGIIMISNATIIIPDHVALDDFFTHSGKQYTVTPRGGITETILARISHTSYFMRLLIRIIFSLVLFGAESLRFAKSLHIIVEEQILAA